MRIKIPTQILLEGVGYGAAVASQKSTKPIHECVAIHADPTTGARVEAADMHVGVRFHFSDAVVEEAGTLVVPAARLASIVREIGEDETTLVDEGGNLALDTGRSHFQIRGERYEEFTELPFFPKSPDVSVAGPTLQNMIRRTVFATAKEPGRFALHGVRYAQTGEGTEMVATDGRRLARIEERHVAETPPKDKNSKRGVKSNASSDGAKLLAFIVMPKALTLVDRMLNARPTAGVDMAVADRQVFFRVHDCMVVSRLVEGAFPPIDGVIPTDMVCTVRVPAAQLLQGIRQALLMTTRDAMSVEFLIDQDEISIRTRATEIGHANVVIPATYDGSPQRLGFNPVLLQDGLKVMDPSAEVTISCGKGKRACLLSDNDSYAYVVGLVDLE